MYEISWGMIQKKVDIFISHPANPKYAWLYHTIKLIYQFFLLSKLEVKSITTLFRKGNTCKWHNNI